MTVDRETLASMAEATAQAALAKIGPNTPMAHAAALMAVAESWRHFANQLEL